jgi:PAS domain S-box-containing protein
MEQTPNLLIVDDNELNLTYLEALVRNINANLILASSGEEALKKTQGVELALAILDVRMPGMNGYELAIKLNDSRIGDKVPIIFLTANHIDEIELFEGYKSGAVDYIFKPVNSHILLCKISVFLDLFNQKQIIVWNSEQLVKSAGALTSANNALKKSEEKYRSYIDNAPDGVFIFDKAGRYLDVNQAACQHTGYSKKELLNMTVNDLLHEDSGEFGLALYKNLAKTGKATADLMSRRKDGNKSWWAIEAIRLDSNTFLCFAKDITERKQTEEKLRREQLFSKALLNSIPGIFYLYTFPELRLVTWNKQHEVLFGFQASEMEGRHVREWYTPESQVDVMKSLESFMDTGEASVETQLLTKDGRLIPFLLTAVKFEDQGQIYLIGIGTNITERNQAQLELQRSEAALAKAQQISHLGSWELDTLTNHMQWSDETFRMFGYSPQTIVPSMELLIKNAHPDDTDSVRKEIAAALVTGLPLSNDYRLILPGCKERTVHIQAEMMINEAGKTEKWLGTIQDISERKKSEEILKNSLEQLHQLSEYSEKARETERAAISRELHDDLGQALTAVKIDLGIIKLSVTGEELVIKINKLTSLVSETIKTVQRLTSQLRPEIIEDLGLEAAIEWYTSEFAHRCGIKVDLQIDSGLNFSPDDSLTLFRIMQESLTNIARHSRASRVEIFLNKEHEDFHFIISDNGIGISEAGLTSRKSFGLISMRERAASLGGSFYIRRKSSGGTEIKLNIPIKTKATYENSDLR